MNTLIISMAHSSAHPNELAAGVQTSSTEVIMRDDSSGTMPGDMSETISDHSASYSAAVKSTKDSLHEKEASTVGFEEVRNKRYKKQKAKSITGCRP